MNTQQVFICGGFDEQRQPVMHCTTCDCRRRMLAQTHLWTGTIWTCLSCGERYASDEGRMERPFAPGWRKKNIKHAKEMWATYGRIVLTKSQLSEWLGL